MDPPPADAELIAGDAGPDVLRPALARLVGEMGIGDLAAHDADQVRFALRQQLLAVGRRLEAIMPNRFEGPFKLRDELRVNARRAGRGGESRKPLSDAAFSPSSGMVYRAALANG